MIGILILVFVICLVLRFPIAFALGLACLAYVSLAGIPLVILPMKMYAGIDIFVLLSVPGFILAGNLMNQGGLTEKIISFCNHDIYILCMYHQNSWLKSNVEYCLLLFYCW